MAKPNYAFAKRQRELAKKQKSEEKRQRKAAGHAANPGEAGGDESGTGELTTGATATPPRDDEQPGPAGLPGAAA